MQSSIPACSSSSTLASSASPRCTPHSLRRNVRACQQSPVHDVHHMQAPGAANATDDDCLLSLLSSSANETQNIEGEGKDTPAQSLKSAAMSQQNTSHSMIATHYGKTACVSTHLPHLVTLLRKRLKLASHALLAMMYVGSALHGQEAIWA